MLVLALGKADLEHLINDPALFYKYEDVVDDVFKALGYWTTLTNIASCVILGLVIKFVRKLTEMPIDLTFSVQSDELQDKVKLNVLVTTIHIALISVYTVVLFVGDNF